MPVARIRASQSETVTAERYSRERHGEVVCLDCRSAVNGVSRTTRNVGDRQIDVSAYFKLPPNAEKLGRGHGPDCRFHTDNIVTRLVASSQRVKDLDQDADSLFERNKNGLTLRVHILMRSLAWSQDHHGAEGDSHRDPAESRIGNRYIRSKEVLDSYLATANEMLTVVELIQNRPSLEEIIKLRYESHKLSWNEYFFGLGEYGKLRQYLLNRGQLSRTSWPNYPVTMAIEIRAGSEAKQTRHGDWQLFARSQADATDESLYISPILYFGHRDIAESVKRESCILACVIPRLDPTVRPPPGPDLHPEVNVTMKIIYPAQVCRYRPIHI